MNIDFNIFDFIDILYIVLLPFAMMIWVTFWLRRQQRSRKMILSIWSGFTLIIVIGLTCLLIGIQSARTYWLNYFSEMAAAHAVAMSKLGHWKIVAGDEEIFSDWSEPVKPEETGTALPVENSAEDQTEAPTEEEYTGGKLAIPKDFAAVSMSPTQVSLRWSPVAGATTYRVQWGKLDWDDEDWEAVYSGAACECSVEGTDTDHLFRIRAETGTPEDDPTYLALMDACDSAAIHSRFISSTYTMRAVEGEDACMFIICPATDMNENGIMDANERPAPIGEKYPNTNVMRHVFSKKVAAINTVPVEDEWGVWVTAFNPIWDPEGNFDGAIGVDFDYSFWSGNLTRAKVWPYSFFFILTVLFFGSVFLVVLNQRSSEEARKVATQLQESVGKLIDATAAAETAMRAKGHFLANMSHEIRTPMNAVLGFANIIGKKLMERCLPEEREQCSQFVELITNSGNDLLTLINDILDFSKVESDQVALESLPLSLTETLNGIEAVMQERIQNKENFVLEFIDEGDLPKLVLSDPTRLRQILNNLIGNAIKFTEAGKVSVCYGVERAKPGDERDMFYIAVRDTGIGMTPEQLKRIFQPFSQADPTLTRRFGGTGLGLSISKRLAVLLGGDIRVTSEEGQGSVFTLSLPIREPSFEAIQKWKAHKQQHDHPAQKSETANSNAVKPLTGFHILVVEDGRINQIVISTQLTEAGAQVTLAENGAIAIETIAAQESTGTPFDIVLMDMQMPVMDGYEATSRLREKGYSRPIIAITAHALSGDCEKTLEVGCDAYLSKPVNGEQLIRLILDIRQER